MSQNEYVATPGDPLEDSDDANDYDWLRARLSAVAIDRLRRDRQVACCAHTKPRFRPGSERVPRRIISRARESCKDRSDAGQAEWNAIMSTPLPSRRKRRPQKAVSDEARAAELLEQLREAELQIRRTMDRRLELMVEATDVGLTTAKIGDAVGASPAAVSRWVRAARGQGM